MAGTHVTAGDEQFGVHDLRKAQEGMGRPQRATEGTEIRTIHGKLRESDTGLLSAIKDSLWYPSAIAERV